MAKELNGRKYYLDTIGGILLIHMIIGHCCQWSQTYSEYQTWAYWLDFFLPWFFFKAGIVFKSRPVKEEIKKSFRRLIIPYFYFSIIGTIVFWTTLCVFGSMSFKSYISQVITRLLLDGAVPGNLVLWFLLSLFMVRIIFSIIHKQLTSTHKLSAKCVWMAAAVVLSTMFVPVYYLLELNYKVYPLWFSNISSGLLFFIAGYLLRNFHPKKAFILMLLAGYVLVMIYYPTVVDMRSGKLIQGDFLLWIPTTLLGILAFNSLFSVWCRHKNIFSAIGARTMPYYCMHWCVIEFVSAFFVSSPGVPNIPKLITLLISNAIILPTATYLITKSRYAYIIS